MKNKTSLVMLGLLCLIALAFVYAVYIWLAVNPAVGRSYAAAFAAAGVVVALLERMASNTVKQYCVVVLLSLICAAYLGEWYVTATTVSRAQQAARLGVAFDDRHPFAFMLDYRRSQGDIRYIYQLARIAQDVSRPLPLHPLGFQAGQRYFGKNEGGQYPIYTLDEHGFNNPAGTWDRPVDALLVGDSFTFGYGVGQGGDAGSFLRGLGVRSLNLGISGNGPLSELACLAEYLEFVQPKWVFWIYYTNDLLDLDNELKDPFLPRYLEPGYSQHLHARQGEVDALVSDVIGTLESADMARYRNYKGSDNPRANFIKLKALRGRGLVIMKALFQKEAPPNLEVFATVLQRAKALCDAKGAKLFFVYLPVGASQADGSGVRRETVLDAVGAQGIPALDFSQVVLADPDPKSLYSLRYSSHFNADGNRRLARFLAEACK